MALYFGWNKLMNTLNPPTKPTTETPQPSPQTQLLEKTNLLSGERVFDYWFLNNEIFYITPEGKILKISADNQEQTIQNTNFESLSDLIVSSDSQKIAVCFSQPEQFRIYSITDNLWQPLDTSIVKFSWSPATTSQIAYLKKNGDLYNLFTYNFAAKTKKETLIATLASQDIDIDWVTPEKPFDATQGKILVYEKPSYYKPASLLSFNPKTKKVEVLINDQSGLMLNWSDNKETALISKSDNLNGAKLYLADKNLKVITEFPFLALPSKCAFSEDNKLVACGVPSPQQIRKNWRFPDDWLIQGPTLSETLYLAQITDEGLYTQTILSDVNVAKIKIHQGKIFFINSQDQKLYSIEIPKG